MHDFTLALFGYFYHHDLIFDWTKCDIPAIIDLLDSELRANTCRLPHRLGRYLYDRFNDMTAHDRTDHLLPEQVAELLQGAPQGVYQCLYFLSGPLGVLRSAELRYLPPSLELPLWHCSDTGCTAVHRVQLRPPRIPLTTAFQEIKQTLAEALGPPAEWEHSLIRRHREANPDRFRHGRRYYDLPALLSDTIIGADMTTLLSRALRASHSNTIRQVIAARATVSQTGSPETVAGRLTPLEQLQLLLLLPDKELIALIDQTVASQQIRIPIGEVRRSRESPPRIGYDARSELSVFGARSVRDNPWATLIGTVLRVYDAQNLWSDLEWQLRTPPGASAKQQLCEMARTRGPAWVVEELILKSKPIADSVCAECDYCADEVLRADTPPVERLLWKFGFTPLAFDAQLPRLLDRLSRFSETLVAIGEVRAEEHRERIRSAGVNLFVSVEDFLERLISFNVWFLKNDHFLRDPFRYDPDAARRRVSDALGQELSDGDNTFRWQAEGGNAIGTLMRYLAESVTWMDSRLDTDKAPLRRPDSNIPGSSTPPDSCSTPMPTVMTPPCAASGCNAPTSAGSITNTTPPDS